MSERRYLPHLEEKHPHTFKRQTASTHPSPQRDRSLGHKPRFGPGKKMLPSWWPKGNLARYWLWWFADTQAKAGEGLCQILCAPGLVHEQRAGGIPSPKAEGWPWTALCLFLWGLSLARCLYSSRLLLQSATLFSYVIQKGEKTSDCNDQLTPPRGMKIRSFGGH